MNSIKQNWNKYPLVVLTTLLVMGCGGGGGGASTGDSAANNTAGNVKPSADMASSVMAVQDSSVAPASSSPAQSSKSSKSSISNSLSSRRSSSSVAGNRAPTVDNLPPSVPESFRIEAAQSDRVVLAWDASVDNNDGPITYRIYRDQVQIDTIYSGDILYYDFDVASNKSYTYSISAGDANDNWSDLNEIAVDTASHTATSNASSFGSSTSANSSASSKSSVAPDTTKPSAPVQVSKLNAYSTKVDISWSAATDNVGVTAYRIYRDAVLIKTVTPDVMEYSDNTVLPDISYWYGVSAGDAAGNWSSQKLVNITTPVVLVVGSITLKWEPPIQRENLVALANSEIGGYEVRYKSLLETTYTYKKIDGNTNQLTLTGLVGDYIFEVAAFDTNEIYSNFTSVKPM